MKVPSIAYVVIWEAVQIICCLYSQFLVYFPYFEKMKVGLCDLQAICVSVALCYPFINFWMAEPVFKIFGMYLTAPKPISATYFINPSHQSSCLLLLGNGSVKLPLSLLGIGSVKTLPRQQTHATIKQLLDASLSMRNLIYQGK
jgi:hypothetical protein